MKHDRTFSDISAYGSTHGARRQWLVAGPVQARTPRAGEDRFLWSRHHRRVTNKGDVQRSTVDGSLRNVPSSRLHRAPHREGSTMTTFKPQVWSDDDPDYAPASATVPTAIRAGNAPAPHRGWVSFEGGLRCAVAYRRRHHQSGPGSAGNSRANSCAGGTGSRTAARLRTRSSGLIARYLSDESPRSRASRATRGRQYRQDCAYWENAATTCSSQTWTS